ncbi:hypothetical protein GWN42_31295 [candidate division KSB1 bacterium]|nr:hypothetical protein [Phycisphaerae bacterium]NIQ92545.1 hypothetical protein [Deltaproteobacteria bacterium]NIV97155.1 hypothetical protein [candidate division KSB1 bacterium]
MNTQEINELAKEIHALAVEKGWWDQDRSRGEVYALIHSEISEAVEEARLGRHPIYFGNKNRFGSIETMMRAASRKIKPQGELIELADVVIRCLDWMAKDGVYFKYIDISSGIYRIYSFDGIEFYNFLHEQLTYLSDSQMNEFILTIELYCESRNWNIWEAVRIKHEYNKTRKHRHGGKKH